MFTIERFGNIIELEILEKESDYSVNINVKINGEVIANKTEAHISSLISEQNKLYLEFISLKNRRTMLLICDRTLDHDDFRNVEEVEENRKITDWMWKEIFGKDTSIMLYGFTTNHWQNWEVG